LVVVAAEEEEESKNIALGWLKSFWMIILLLSYSKVISKLKRNHCGGKT
jgi:hypothetical protein